MKSTSGPGATPWRPLDVGIFVGGQVVGLALLLVGWIQASGELRPKGQIGSLNLGIVGAAVAVAAALRFQGRGRRAVAARRGLVSQTLKRSGPWRSVRGEVDLRAVPAAHADAGLVSSERMTKYHRPGCQLVAGKAVVAGGRRTHEEAGRRPCGVCEP